VGREKCENCQFIRPSTLRPTFVVKDLWEAARVIQNDLRESRSHQQVRERTKN
jgi:hypothetical protein